MGTPRRSLARPHASHGPSSRGSARSNIKVYVRSRRRNQREIDEHSGVVVTTQGNGAKEISVQTGQAAYTGKQFTFDRVFGPEADQELVYDCVARPFVREVLDGFNCTIFAYGQTGTGKTYTITGGLDGGQEAGIIPRVLTDLFGELAKLESGEKRMSMAPGGDERSDWAVKVSYVELYNEELRDLLGDSLVDDKKAVRIFDDAAKRGTVMQGMEECFIKSPSEGLELLRLGAANRQTAATKCNDLSSRSHCVFALTVHTREVDPKSGEERVHVGKLNVVDLAGSENISRSGATNARAREAGLINQSLLTLGRVINALVERSPHVPYRESKLTRILQDSLGGATKTAIVATVSPARVSLDETLSTLEYASRAKNIQNKPEANASLSKQMHILDYVREIERLKGDLRAVRERNGVYLTQESYDTLVAESESRKNLLDEQRLRLDLVETQLREARHKADEFDSVVAALTAQVEAEKQQREAAEEQARRKQQELAAMQAELEREREVSRARYESEQRLHAVAGSLRQTVAQSRTETAQLHAKLNRARVAHDANAEQLRLAKEKVDQVANGLHTRSAKLGIDLESMTQAVCSGLDALATQQISALESAFQAIQGQENAVGETTRTTQQHISETIEQLSQHMDKITSLRDTASEAVASCTAEAKSLAQSAVDETINSTRQLQDTLQDSFHAIGVLFKESHDAFKAHLGKSDESLATLGTQLDSLKTAIGEDTARRMDALNDLVANEQRQADAEHQALTASVAALADLVASFGQKRAQFLRDSLKPELSTVSQTIEHVVDASLEPSRAAVADQRRSHTAMVDTLRVKKSELKSGVNQQCEKAQDACGSLRTLVERHGTAAATAADTHAKTLQTHLSDITNVANTTTTFSKSRFETVSTVLRTLREDSASGLTTYTATNTANTQSLAATLHRISDSAKSHLQLHHDFAFDHFTALDRLRDHLSDITTVEIQATGSTPAESALHVDLPQIPDVFTPSPDRDPLSPMQLNSLPRDLDVK